jgi:hypothetical protein
MVRATTVLLVCAGGLAACGVARPTIQARPEAPSTTAVVKARFANAVDLDDGGLLVTPPAAGAKANVTESEADAMFEATDAVQGPHEFAILGLGVVTVAPRVEKPATTTTTTTTAPPPPSTVPPTTAPPPTAPPTTAAKPPPTTTTAPTTTAPPVTPTTTPPTTSPTTADRPSPSHRIKVSTGSLEGTALVADAVAEGPPAPSSTLLATAPSTTAPSTTAPSTTAPSTTGVPTTTPALGTSPTTTTTTLPTYRHRLAWVGIAWGATVTCGGSTTTQPTSDSATDYVAVVIDARTPNRVIAYRSAGTSPCTGTAQTPLVSEPNELLSVPWQPVGPSSTAVQIQVPPCGRYFGWTQVPGTNGALADQVVVSVPFDPVCDSSETQSQPVDQVVPLGPAQNLVAHAPTGPVQALQALPSD